MKHLAWIALLLGAQAFADPVTITQEDWSFELRDDASHVLTELDKNGKVVPIKRATLEECRAALRVEFMKGTADLTRYRCFQTVRFTASGSCENEPKPPGVIAGTLDGEGFTIVGELVTGACLSDDTKSDIRSVVYQPKSFREGCWLKVETPLAKCSDKPKPDTVVGEANDPDGPGLPLLDESVWARVPNIAKLRGPEIDTGPPGFYTPALAPGALDGEHQ